MHEKKLWFGLLILFFVVIPALKFSGGWALFWLPFLFFWFAGSRRWHHHHNGGHWGMMGACDTGEPAHRKRKNDDKPKRDYIETVDGELLEVIDEPRSV